MKHSVLKTDEMTSQLGNLGQMNPKLRPSKRQLVMTLALTSLVDAFSILVIYLLVNTSASQQVIEQKKGIQLPQAIHTDNLKEADILKVGTDGKYKLNGQEIQIRHLSQHLKNTKQVQKKDQRPDLIIQADKKLGYQALNPILLETSKVGFYRIRFAVLKKEGQL